MAVTQLLITSRQPFAHGQTFGPVGPYEQLSGTVYFAVDPLHAANQLITDLPLAPRDPRGQVHFSADYCVVKPVEPQRGNHRLLFDIVNRGRPLALVILSKLDRLGETRHVRCRYLPRVSTRSSSRPWSTVYQQVIRTGGRGRAWR
jgi:hypothetical protein